MGLDRVKRGRGPIMVRTVAGTVLVVLVSSVYSMMKIQKRGIDDGVVNPTDQVRMAKHLLEASFMGFILFLELMMAVLGAKLKQLESEIETKTKEAKAVETNAEALRKEYVGFLLEYDRLLEENQNLRNKLQSFDRRLSHSGSKRNT